MLASKGTQKVWFHGGISHFSWGCRPCPVPLNQTNDPNMYVTKAQPNWTQSVALMLHDHPDPHLVWRHSFPQLLGALAAIKVTASCSPCLKQGQLWRVPWNSGAPLWDGWDLCWAAFQSNFSLCPMLLPLLSPISVLHANCLPRVCFPGKLI